MLSFVYFVSQWAVSESFSMFCYCLPSHYWPWRAASYNLHRQYCFRIWRSFSCGRPQENSTTPSPRFGRTIVFAEDIVEARSNISDDKSSSGLVNSRSTIRALLWLRVEDRTALTRYRGPAVFVRLRSICFTPQFDTSTSSLINSTVTNATFSGQLSNM